MPVRNNEIRSIDIDIQKSTEEEPLKLRGYAIVYNSLSEPLYGDLFRERINRGAFTKSLLENDQVCLWGHDTRYVLGRKSSGTLILREDEKGLYFEVSMPNTTWARDLKESVDRGDIKQMSFGFKVVRDNWIDDKETLKEYGMPIREVEEIALHEISLVTFPAYPQTNVRHTHSANEDAYIPTPPQKSVINDGFDDRSNEYEIKIKYLKIKNK
ncbi:HK97 family phage prohead protease [Brachyspira hyodysenteriae]|uniref:HK97 family phage prohead protease n=1 Tax=Brachyspira hyodysenteriae TaxID=159 RepID=UPI0022CD5C64|nr:HK97 family phage prohead protease [Brachyspira hyodysenteriae]MCZ9852475.1 HK97 family phage prohead protease [Brachyspira hyodysenteriae]MCZ9852494.1 HK97 family phage prohead protease [Brachyspira hyodysenteriae]MCZ9862076.1 HK97 family phage prohead protease [Brachyspira hyodysenteriae]MCZ9862139.1 HK97 family phage prohead protease [Brachyspira hyodysenteriae]MCZ9870346.1 HK97 family phage prohead protease [Brachyspira hyodysenteriae]